MFKGSDSLRGRDHGVGLSILCIKTLYSWIPCTNMNASALVMLIVGILSFLGGIIALIAARRKLKGETREVNARAASEEVDTQAKVSDFLKEIKDENVDLYKKNIVLEKQVTDQLRQIEVLTQRLTERDAQLEAATKDLNLFRDLAKNTPITKTLQDQLEIVNRLLSETQAALLQSITQKEETIRELTRTNSDIRLQKPGKTDQ
jgi:hypothetical protein